MCCSIRHQESSSIQMVVARRMDQSHQASATQTSSSRYLFTFTTHSNFPSPRPGFTSSGIAGSGWMQPTANRGGKEPHTVVAVVDSSGFWESL
jgi:hypothetical protein